MRTSFLSTATACLVAMAALVGCGGGTDEQEPLTLGLPPGEASPEFQERFAPVRQLIEQATGRPVEVTVTSDYLAIVEAMRSGLIDLSVFSPFPTPIAVEVANVDPLVAGTTEVYSSLLVCRTDRGIDSIADVRGTTVAFVDPGSTSGNYIPKLLLQRAGIDPDTDVAGTYAGGHDVALLAVAQGSADCAANSAQSHARAVAEGAVDPAQLQIVAESEPIPISIIMIAREGLDPAVKDAVTHAFVGDPPQAVLEAATVTGFVPAEPELFAMFREAARELGVDLADVQ